MRKIVLIPFVVALACTKHNPESCCSTADQCSSFGLGGITPCAGTQVCDPTGTCVMPQCSVSTDCTDPTKPFCENQFCVAACGSDGDCMGMAGTPFCGSAGACVACLDDSACTTAQAPVCDGSANSCRGCEKDSECASGVCLESNGICADAANVIFVRDDGSDVGDCPATSPCLTLPYAFTKMAAPKNVVKILSTTYFVPATLTPQVTGFLDGTATTVSGGGSDGIFQVDGGDLTITGMVLEPTIAPVLVADVRDGRLSLYGDTLDSDVDVNGGELDIDRSTLQIVNCGNAIGGGVLSVSRSQLVEATAMGCTVTLEQNTIDQTALPGNEPMIMLLTSTFTVENNVVVSANFFTDAVQLGASSASTFRFNTMVNLSGENMTATAIACETAGIDVSDDIIAWYTSTPPQCPTTYTLYDSIEALPPGQGVQIGDVSTFFVDMADKNFHLAPGSPAIGAAQPGASIAVDHDGNPRGSSADVGAFEAP